MIEFANLGFEPVLAVEDMAHGPRSGVAHFCGVPYAFEPSTSPSEGWTPWGLLCDLRPNDPATGLPMLADGVFRSRRSDQRLEVRWTSLGSPGLASAPNLRARFADFLERLAAGTATLAHWNAFEVEHYQDALVEQIRVDVVRLFEVWTEEFSLQRGTEPYHRSRLLAWAQSLRTGAGARA